MGSCFLGLLEAQAKLLSAASDVMAPLGAYKEVGKGLNHASSSLVKEATVGWLAAAQVSTPIEVAQKILFKGVLQTQFELPVCLHGWPI